MLYHQFVSSLSDGSTAALVKPSDWNASHVRSIYAIPVTMQLFGPLQNARAVGPTAVGTWSFVSSNPYTGAKRLNYQTFSIHAVRWVQNWIPRTVTYQTRLISFTDWSGSFTPLNLSTLAVFSGTSTNSPVTDSIVVTSAFNVLVNSPTDGYISIQTLGNSWQLFESKLELEYRIEM